MQNRLGIDAAVSMPESGVFWARWGANWTRANCGKLSLLTVAFIVFLQLSKALRRAARISRVADAAALRCDGAINDGAARLQTFKSVAQAPDEWTS
jgi:hypothetical protein